MSCNTGTKEPGAYGRRVATRWINCGDLQHGSRVMNQSDNSEHLDQIIDLDASQLAEVAGGINPQPLPPAHDLD